MISKEFNRVLYGAYVEKYWWVRVGDQGDYEQFDSLDEVGDYLSQLGIAPPYDQSTSYGFETDSYYGNNYISLYKGNADAQPTDTLKKSNLLYLEKYYKKNNKYSSKNNNTKIDRFRIVNDAKNLLKEAWDWDQYGIVPSGWREGSEIQYAIGNLRVAIEKLKNAFYWDLSENETDVVSYVINLIHQAMIASFYPNLLKAIQVLDEFEKPLAREEISRLSSKKKAILGPEAWERYNLPDSEDVIREPDEILWESGDRRIAEEPDGWIRVDVGDYSDYVEVKNGRVIYTRPNRIPASMKRIVDRVLLGK